MTKTYLNDLIYQVNGAAIEVHKAIGPGMLESVYHSCLKHELALSGIEFKSELLIPIEYKGHQVQADMRCDLMIEGILPVELKAVEKLLPIHEAQLLTYMSLLKAPKGLLLNFNVMNLFREGQKTLVNELYRGLNDF